MKKVSVDEALCIHCGACMSIAKDIFGYGDDGQSVPKVETVKDDNKDAVTAMESCPTGAISLENVDETSEDECEECDCDHCECHK